MTALLVAALSLSTSVSAQSDNQKKVEKKECCKQQNGKCDAKKKAVDGTTASTAQVQNAPSCCKKDKDASCCKKDNDSKSQSCCKQKKLKKADVSTTSKKVSKKAANVSTARAGKLKTAATTASCCQK